jgi:ADP-ribose pyrophosphatase
MDSLVEHTISSQTIFTGKVIRLQLDQVELPNGQIARREIVKHPGAVCLLAITAENKLLLVRQFRKALEKTILELPAGKLEQGEDPHVCAERELAEETGYRAKSLQHVVSFYTSPGFADEYIHLYRTSGLAKKGAVHLDADEFVEPVELTLAECFQCMQTGEICDAKTIVAIYLWQHQVMRER